MQVSCLFLVDSRSCRHMHIKGDWKYIVEALNLTQLWSSNAVCHLCRAHRHIRWLWWTRYQRQCGLRNTRRTNEQFKARGMEQHIYSPFLHLRGFTIWRVWTDAMHNLDLGVYQWIVPSAIWEVTTDRTIFHAPTRAMRLLLLYLDYKAWCKRHNIQAPLKKFQLKSFKKRNHARQWTQHTAKGAQMKHLLFWLRDLCAEHVATEHDLVRSALFNSIVMFEETCAGEGRFMRPEAAERVAVATEAWLKCLNWLNTDADGNGLWHMTPKCHMTTHLSFDFAVKTNPRRCTCYSDEDMVGKMKRILEHCHGATCHSRGQLRYLIWVSIRWWILLHKLRGIPL